MMNCEGDRKGHRQADCPILVDISTLVEQVDFVGNAMRGQGNLYSSTFKQGWRNYPNFSWSTYRQ